MSSSEAGVQRPPRVTQFRYGELLVLLRQSPEDAVRLDERDSDDLYEEMRQVFAGVAKVQLFDKDPFRDLGRSKEQSFVRLSRRSDSFRFRPVALDAWRENLEHIDGPEGDPDGLNAANEAVARACKDLNDNRANITGRGWQFVAATPNWRVMALCVPGVGGPGGRPVKARGPKRFRREDVQDEVTSRIGKTVTSNLTSCEKIRVAILDTWPMDDEPTVEIGERPANPLGKIRKFVETRPAAADNPLLKMAIDGRLVAKENFRDYVSNHPTKHLPMRHFNWKRRRLEPFYAIPDHGLFIAGIIKDIAPNAELAVYRVLNDHGTTDLATLVQALEQAIEDARVAGKKLVINMSLAFAPPMRTIKKLLDKPVEVQEEKVWSTLVEEAGVPENEYYETKAKPREKDGVASLAREDSGRKVKRTTGPV